MEILIELAGKVTKIKEKCCTHLMKAGSSFRTLCTTNFAQLQVRVTSLLLLLF